MTDIEQAKENDSPNSPDNHADPEALAEPPIEEEDLDNLLTHLVTLTHNSIPDQASPGQLFINGTRPDHDLELRSPEADANELDSLLHALIDNHMPPDD